MISQAYVVKNKVGLHARPASLLVKKASEFKSEIEMKHGASTANVKSILSLLSLGASKGSQIMINIKGDDEAEAMAAILEILNNFED
ncbi:MAG TPA: HPr family phosphocarrier protein [Peptococcaceae bacterium]|nr:HPr family phosphocarrier protein [Peptococcaceae bacterium]